MWRRRYDVRRNLSKFREEKIRDKIEELRETRNMERMIEDNEEGGGTGRIK